MAGKKPPCRRDEIPAATQLFTPHWIVRYLVENSLGRLWLLNRPGSRLARAHGLLHRGRSGDRLPQDHQARRKSSSSIPPAAAGTCSPTPSTCSTRSTRRKATRPAEIPGLILTAQSLRAGDLPARRPARRVRAPLQSPRNFPSRLPPEHLVPPHMIELDDVRFEENELRDYIRALGLGDLFNQPCSSCSTSSRRRRISARSSSRASMNGLSPSPAGHRGERTSAASFSCARHTSKSCACWNRPRRSPSGITSSWPIRHIWEVSSSTQS